MARDRRHRDYHRSHRSRSKTVSRKSRSLGPRLLVVVLGVLLVGTVAGLLWPRRLDPQPFVHVIAITDYADARFPANPWAQHDTQEICHHWDATCSTNLEGPDRASLMASIETVLQQAQASDLRGKPVVVYLNALALTHREKVYILPSRAQIADPRTWLPVSDIIARLASGRGPRLLILDISRPVWDAQLGLIENPVAKTLHAELHEAQNQGRLPFLVLTSCGPGEVAWSTPELRRSVFGFFMDHALAGHADGWGGRGVEDGRISARELIDFVRTQVPHWMASTRAPAQTPQIYGKGQDFVLTTPTRPFRPMSLPDVFDDYPSWLAEGWRERDRWEADGTSRRVPRTFLELQVLLRRMQDQWLAGQDEGRIQKEFAARFEALATIRRDLQVKPIPPYSVARWKHHGSTSPTLSATLRALRDRFQADKKPFTLEETKPLREFLASPTESPTMLTPAMRHIALTQYVVEILLEMPDPPHDLIKAFDELLRNAPAAVPTVEMAAIHFLAELDTGVDESWRDEAFAGIRNTVLRTIVTAEEATAGDPRLIASFRTAWSENEEKQRQALVRLVTGEVRERIDAYRQLQQCLKRWEQLVVQARAWELAWQRIEELQVILVPFAETLALGQETPVDAQLWRSLLTHFDTLQHLLAPSSMPADTPTEELSRIAEQLHFDINRYRQRFGMEECDRWLRTAGTEGGPTPRDLWHALTFPQWSWPVRQRLYQTARDMASAFAMDAFAKAKKLGPRTGPAVNTKTLVPSSQWRARLALDILRLSQCPDLASYEQSMNRGDWEVLGEAIHRERTVLLPERLRKQTDLWTQERLGVVTHPADRSVVPEEPGQVPWEPASLRLRRASMDLAQWLANERLQQSAERFAATHHPALKQWGQTLDRIRQLLLSYSP